MTDQTVTLKLTRDEVSELKRLLIKEARWLSGCYGPTVEDDEKNLDELRQKIHNHLNG